MSDRATPAGTGRSTLVMARRTDADGSVWRAVHLTGDGRLVVEGHDLGPGVERILGCREYEFRRTLTATQSATLRDLLGLTGDADLLAAVERRFAATHELERFLVDHGIPGAFWSRRGD